MGLSAQVVLCVYVLVFVIGWMRLIPEDESFQEKKAFNPPWMALIFLSIPMILGVFVPVRSLSTASLNSRGVGFSAPTSLNQQTIKTVDVKADDRTVLDWIKVFNYDKDFSAYLGQSANVIGFVYHDSRLKSNQFMVGRFAITCCVADAFAIGMVVDWEDSAHLKDNSWVNVRGVVDVMTIDNQRVPVIHAKSVTPIKEPENPYLYP
jgi:uncharacterized repeat protein (TIGR03943 family)